MQLWREEEPSAVQYTQIYLSPDNDIQLSSINKHLITITKSITNWSSRKRHNKLMPPQFVLNHHNISYTTVIKSLRQYWIAVFLFASFLFSSPDDQYGRGGIRASFLRFFFIVCATVTWGSSPSASRISLRWNVLSAPKIDSRPQNAK